MKKSIILVYSLLSFLFPMWGDAQAIIGLDNAHNSLDVNGYAYIHANTEGDNSVDKLRQLDNAQGWSLMPSSYLQIAYKNDYSWVRLSVKAEEDLSDEWYFWLDAAIAQEVKLYVFDGETLLFSDTLGLNYPFYKRKINSQYPIAPLKLKKGQILTIYASFHNDVTSLKGYLRLTTRRHFEFLNLKESINYISYFTFLILSSIVSLALWIFWREKIYIFFAAYIICTMLMSANYKGYAFMWIWYNSPYLATISRGIWSAGALLFFLYFEKALLFDKNSLPNRLKNWFTFLTYTLIILIAIGSLNIDAEYARMLVRIANIIFVCCLITIIAMLVMVRKHYRNTAIFFLVAFTPLVLVSLGIVLHNNKILPNVLGRSEVPFVMALSFEILFLFIALFKRFQTIKKNQERQEELEQQAKQQLQEERERISRELHDNVGARVAHLIGQIDNLEYRLERDKSEQNINSAIEKLENVGENARGVMNILRETIWAVKEESIPLELFTAKIRSYLQAHIVDSITYEVHFNCHDDIHLTPGQALNLFRIVQEACQNAQKHAQASHLMIDVKCQNAVLNIIISDNGKGITPSVSDDLEGHYGLKNMQFRAVEIGGSMVIDTQQDRGTSVILTIAL